MIAFLRWAIKRHPLLLAAAVIGYVAMLFQAGIAILALMS